MPRYKAGASRGQALVALSPILFPLTLYLKPRSRGRVSLARLAALSNFGVLAQPCFGRPGVRSMSYSSVALNQYLVRHTISGAAADYLRQAHAGLARDIGTGGYACVVTEYQSRKMGVTVNTESRTHESVYALHLDFDGRVEAFFEQPPAVDCRRATKRGHSRLINYVPDMLILSDAGPYVAQVKPERELLSKVAQSKDWIQEADGTIRDLAAERAFKHLALPHVVVSTSSLNKLRAANISLLLQSLEYGAADEALKEACAAFLTDHPITRLQDLVEYLGLVDYTPLLYLIARHQLFTDLSSFPLTEPAACFVSLSPGLLRTEVYDAMQHFRLAQGGVGDPTAGQDLLPLSKHLAKGVAIVDRIDEGLTGRSARRWNAKIAAGVRAGLSRVAAATPRHDLSGNRSAKRPLVVLAYAENIIRTEWAAATKPSPAALWRSYKTSAENWHPDYRPISRPTFRVLTVELTGPLARQRGGQRMANALSAPTDVDERALKPTRPFELASCDHYKCDLHCVVLHANGMAYVMKPWLTVLRDCYTKSVLAFWLSLRDPSRRSCALIIRQCLRTHGRLPEWLIVDRGSDFRSNFFSGLMSHCRVNLMFRPSGHPRYGAEAERFFGQFKELWLSSRPGNRVNLREVRAVSGSHRPENLACLSLLDLWEDLVEFNAWFDHYTVPSSIASPAILAAEGLQRFSCSGRIIPYDDTFLIASAVDDATYTLDPQRGLHIDAFHFWHPNFGGRPRQSIPVRRDPQDPYRAYALIDGHWVTCKASAAPGYDTKHPLLQATEGVIMLDGTELRTAVRDDADRLLMEALRKRQAASALLPDVGPAALAMPWSPPGPDTETDYFAEVARQSITPAGTGAW